MKRYALALIALLIAVSVRAEPLNILNGDARNQVRMLNENFVDIDQNKQSRLTAVRTYGDQTIAGEKTFSGNIAASSVTASGDITTTGKFKGDGGELTGLPSQTPSGSIVMYGGASAPTGWLFCDGSAVSRETYAALFTAIGTAFGTGDGSTTFNLPDMRDNSAIGKSDTKALAATGGEATHTLTTAEIPAHLHPITDKQHGHSPLQESASGTSEESITRGDHTASAVSVGSAYTGITATNNNTGGGGAHNNLPPYVALNFIIKA